MIPTVTYNSFKPHPQVQLMENPLFIEANLEENYSMRQLKALDFNFGKR